MTFFDHLEVMRGVILRSLLVVCVMSVVAFCFRNPLFSFILRPLHDVGGSLISTELTAQFVVHLEIALLVGIVLASPYILAELLVFIAPALYPHERRVLFPAVVMGYLLFGAGAALCYGIIFPFTCRFLMDYQVAEDIPNLITISSYVSTLLVLTLMMGVLFELPLLSWILGRLGILKRASMTRYARHAIVAIFVLAAVITPTGDAFTLLLTALPITILYVLSIFLVPKS